ncbi:hypothetical protein [Reyranella sp. CPCC 100927]|uniref:hypothetical protein n=1 Tax=Reyranella sp. CPCC 100927 TaxID=2599616 RepID=UPI0011B377B6|nr:hypothetical protein [Reyranella sp. CPCC 100927]TWT13721.1 hypothetical protein FQU96_07335 [Reyranella sp. CPCC 100927]
MRKVAVLCLGMLSAFGVLVAGVQAQQYTYIGGLYESEMVSLRLLLLDSASGDVAWESSVRSPGGPGCAGGASGLGKMVGGTLELRPYKREDGAGACVISVTFSIARAANNRSPRSATLSERDCLYYHGASCGWEGEVTRKPSPEDQ